MDALEDRQELFQSARQRAEWTVLQLWLGYLALGGRMDMLTVEAYLHGLVPLPPDQQNVLATAVNERLDHLCRTAKVPYLDPLGQQIPPMEDPLDVLDEILALRRKRTGTE